MKDGRSGIFFKNTLASCFFALQQRFSSPLFFFLLVFVSSFIRPRASMPTHLSGEIQGRVAVVQFFRPRFLFVVGVEFFFFFFTRLAGRRLTKDSLASRSSSPLTRLAFSVFRSLLPAHRATARDQRDNIVCCSSREREHRTRN